MDPLEILLVTSGTRGERLLFRYPFESDDKDRKSSKAVNRNPYAVKIAEDIQSQRCDEKIGTEKCRFSNTLLASLLAPKSTLCYQNFDLKIDDIRFIGFPVLLHETLPKQTGHRIITVNVVFALKANLEKFIIDRFHIICKQLTVAIQHEERRCNYLSVQAKVMMALHDEMAARTEDCLESPYKLILQKSQLANELKQVFDSLCSTGVVRMYLNNWIEINVCLPTIYNDFLPSSSSKCDFSAIEKCISGLRPYHGVLLTVDEQALLDSLPMDSTPALTRLVKATSPLKNIQTIALDADLSLSQVFQLVCHLIYWAKAIIIYPLCETNTYIISPHANIYVNSNLVQIFVDEFPGKNLHVELAEFSLPKQLRDGNIFEHRYKQAQSVKMVIWLLQHQLLMQLHKYISIIAPKYKYDIDPDKQTDTPQVIEEDIFSVLLDDNHLTRTHSLSDLASVNSDESFGGVQLDNHEPIVAQMNSDVLKAIKSLPAAKNVEDLKFFLKLCPYFNGKCHIEEIMFYENISRSQITTLLDKFKDILVVYSHQDPATTFFT
ncbi:GATOR complex protein NPRL3 [Patella vulgata]|uniref:GATOR complex protein NPRL3 n=1 Tax=Patella vulgata TaxID=6465 RepID=UPI0021804FFF|nr:GATOR complex protein NPRL3 [Patella vulgata]